MTNNKDKEIQKLCKELKLSDQLNRTITKKYSETKDYARLSGKRANTIIAAITYHHCRENKERRNQEDISKILGVTQVSLRNVLKNIYELPELDAWLRRT